MYMGVLKIAKKNLFALMEMEGKPPFFLHDNKLYILSGIEREDGSGKTFNVTAKRQGDNTVYKFFARTYSL